MLDDLAAAALEFANFLATRDNGPTHTALLPGVPKDCAECPVARTAGPMWELGRGGALKVGPRGGIRDHVPVPEDVLEFMAAFDCGAYPNLILAPASIGQNTVTA